MDSTTQPPTTTPATTTEKPAASESAGARHRSPNYPGIGLEDAIKKSRLIYKEEMRHAADPATLCVHMKISPKSSTGLTTLAAMKQYGLLDKATGKQLRLAQTALDILIEPEGSERHVAAIKKAALEPALHKALWEQHDGNLPSDINLKARLENDRGFSAKAAADFLKQFRATLAFAGLTESGTLSVSQDRSGSVGGAENQGFEAPAPPQPFQIEAPMPATVSQPTAPQREAPPATTAPLKVREWHIPLSDDPGEFAVIRTPFPMTTDQWDMLETTLMGWKKVMVKDPKPEAPKSEATEPVE